MRHDCPNYLGLERTPSKIGGDCSLANDKLNLSRHLFRLPLRANFLCTGTAVLEYNYECDARESFRTPSFWKQMRRAARFATSSSLLLTYLVVISSDFNTDFCVAHTAVRRWLIIQMRQSFCGRHIGRDLMIPLYISSA